MLFTKMHGAGNDFVVIDARSGDQNWGNLARSICDRHFGVGGDGIILICSSNIGDLRMRMFNPDGSEAEMSGNGIRLFAKFVIDRNITEKICLKFSFIWFSPIFQKLMIKIHFLLNKRNTTV